MSDTIYRVKDNPTLQALPVSHDIEDENYLSFEAGHLVTNVTDYIGSSYVGDDLVNARSLHGGLTQTLDRSSLEEVTD